MAIAKPSLGWSNPFGRASRVRQSSLVRNGSAKTLLNCPGRVRRDVLGKPAGEPAKANQMSIHGEALTALGAAGSQYAAAVLGCHACSETVSAGAFESARLESTFHGGSSLESRYAMDEPSQRATNLRLGDRFVK